VFLFRISIHVIYRTSDIELIYNSYNCWPDSCSKRDFQLIFGPIQDALDAGFSSQQDSEMQISISFDTVCFDEIGPFDCTYLSNMCVQTVTVTGFCKILIGFHARISRHVLFLSKVRKTQKCRLSIFSSLHEKVENLSISPLGGKIWQTHF
jgi:hypothetical protein